MDPSFSKRGWGDLQPPVKPSPLAGEANSYCSFPQGVALLPVASGGSPLTYNIVSSRPVFYAELFIDDGFALSFIDILLVRDDGGLHFGNVFFSLGDELFDLVVDAVPEHG